MIWNEEKKQNHAQLISVWYLFNLTIFFNLAMWKNASCWKDITNALLFWTLSVGDYFVFKLYGKGDYFFKLHAAKRNAVESA